MNFASISQEQYLKQAEGIMGDFKNDPNKLDSLRNSDAELAQCIEKENIKGLALALKVRRDEKVKKMAKE